MRSMTETIYVRHASGDAYAIEVSHGGTLSGDVALVTAVCGPLDESELTQANLDGDNFNWDRTPDLCAWMDDAPASRIAPPYPSDMRD